MRSARKPATAKSTRPRPEPAEVSGRILVDSGPLLALFNAADDWHTRILAWLQKHVEARLVSTWPVATEVCALLARRIGNEAALDFLRWIERGGVELDLPGSTSLAEVIEISERFRDLPFDLADASIAEAASRMRLRNVLTIDSDFDIYRDRRGRSLVNVLRET